MVHLHLFIDFSHRIRMLLCISTILVKWGMLSSSIFFAGGNQWCSLLLNCLQFSDGGRPRILSQIESESSLEQSRRRRRPPFIDLLLVDTFYRILSPLLSIPVSATSQELFRRVSAIWPPFPWSCPSLSARLETNPRLSRSVSWEKKGWRRFFEGETQDGRSSLPARRESLDRWERSSSIHRTVWVEYLLLV